MALWEQLLHYRGIQVMINRGLHIPCTTVRIRAASSAHATMSNAVDVSDPAVTIAGLEPSTNYYFAVSAYDNNSGLRSMCSEEVSKLTPEQELYIGDPPVKVM